MPLALKPPIKFPHRLANLSLKWRYFNASFVGAATQYQGVYHQRKEWVTELSDAKLPRVQVGLISTEHNPLDHLFTEPKRYQHRFLGPGFYAALMVQSKLSFTPAGNAKWTYRHFESVQAGTVLVSTDLSDVDLLIPLPTQATIYVPDHAPVAPVIQSTLSTLHTLQPLVRQAQAQLNHYLTRGYYDPQKPAAILAFLNLWNE